MGVGKRARKREREGWQGFMDDKREWERERERESERERERERGEERDEREGDGRGSWTTPS